MSDESNSDGKRSSLDFFVPPEQGTVNSGDDAQAYLERRLQKHKDYLRTARHAQKSIDGLRATQEHIEKARKLK
jgi:hypothetical protein